MGKGVPARVTAVAIGVLLLLCLALAGHRSSRSAAAGRTTHRVDDAAAADTDGYMRPMQRLPAAASTHTSSTAPEDSAADSADDGASGPDPACHGDRRAALSRLYAMHARPGDADEAIDAALLLLQLRRDEDAAALLAAASDRWPRDLELAWFSWSQCDSATCDRAARLRRLLALDPDNAVTWMSAVEDAWQRRRENDQAVDVALERAAHAPAYATHEGMLFLHGMGLAREMSLSPRCAAVVRREMEKEMHHAVDADDIAVTEAENMENRVLPPGYAIRSACLPAAAPQASARRTACIVLLRRMAGADTLLERDIGVTGLLDLLPDLPRDDPLREAYRREQWLNEQFSRLSYSPGSLTQMHAEGGWKTLIGLAAAQGLWPPPADWLPEAPGMRSRVLGTPPPARSHGRRAPE